MHKVKLKMSVISWHVGVEGKLLLYYRLEDNTTIGSTIQHYFPFSITLILWGDLFIKTYFCYNHFFLYCFSIFTGPIVSAFTNRYGCRPVAIVGSIIGAFAFLLATLSPNVDILIVLYGAVGGELMIFYSNFLKKLLFLLNNFCMMRRRM